MSWLVSSERSEHIAAIPALRSSNIKSCFDWVFFKAIPTIPSVFWKKRKKKKKKRKHFAFIPGERKSLNFSCICKSALWKQFVQPVRFWGELYYVTRALDKTAGTGRDFDFPNCTTAMTGSAALTSLLLQNVQAWLGRAISPCIATSGWSNYQ